MPSAVKSQGFHQNGASFLVYIRLLYLGEQMRNLHTGTTHQLLRWCPGGQQCPGDQGRGGGRGKWRQGEVEAGKAEPVGGGAREDGPGEAEPVGGGARGRQAGEGAELGVFPACCHARKPY